MPVVLTRPATIRIDPGTGSSPDVSITGDGRFAGLVLAEAGAPAIGSDRFQAMQMGFCWSQGCDPVDPAVFVGADTSAKPVPDADGKHSLYTLSAGAYNLHLVADGARVVVTLRLAGLGGAVSLSPRTQEDLQFTDLTNATDSLGPLAGSFYSAGGVGTIGGSGGMVVTETAIDRSVSGSKLDGMCVYQGGAPPGGLYLPYCPGSYSAGELIIPTAAPTASRSVGYGSVSGIPGGTWGIGDGVYTAGVVSDAHTAGFWLSYDGSTGGSIGIASASTRRASAQSAPARRLAAPDGPPRRRHLRYPTPL
jgi:hypothetical protein